MTDEEKDFDKWVDYVILTHEKIQEICVGKDDGTRDKCLSGEATKVNTIDSASQHNKRTSPG